MPQKPKKIWHQKFHRFLNFPKNPQWFTYKTINIIEIYEATSILLTLDLSKSYEKCLKNKQIFDIKNFIDFFSDIIDFCIFRRIHNDLHIKRYILLKFTMRRAFCSPRICLNHTGSASKTGKDLTSKISKIFFRLHRLLYFPKNKRWFDNYNM